MKPTAIKKLHSQAGETIAETLIALLISALALVMLAGAISTAARLIDRSEDVMEKYYEGINGLGNPNQSSISMTLKESGTTVYLPDGDSPITVSYSINDAFSSKPVIAYAK